MTYRFWAVLLFLATMACCWLLGSWAGYRTLEKESLEEAFRYSQLVANELNRYRPIPELMAEHPLMESVLRKPSDELLVLQANEEMKKMAQIVGSSDVYLMDSTGFTIAANNYQQDDSFIGRIFDFRPYFQDAMRTGDTAIYFALGTTSDIRGLYFSHPVKSDRGRILGVIAVKVQVNDLESQWQRPVALNHAEMVVLDDEGISFLASRDEWLYRDFEPRTVSPRPNLRYPERDLAPIDFVRLGRPVGVSDRSMLMRVEEHGIDQEYLSIRMPLPQLDWTLQVMIETQQVVWIRLQFLIAGFVIFLGCFLTWLYLRERYKREAELAQRGIVLERRVAERTADLESSNRKLLEEIRQREEAQTELKETQQELIQAAKLAVLGQMSAGLNHEMNQPLTAIQTYARNSRRFLERGESTMVDANLLEIGHLCDKMAELTRQFKVFARKSEGPPSSVDLRQPVDAALKIITAQESSDGVAIDWQRPDNPVMCHGDMIRIEQVLVNLIANAIQAVEGRDDPRIIIDIREQDGCWQCRIRDNGPGLPANSEQVFEPFFTTKSMKQGLGLGLSISRQIVDALGGRLTGHNRSDAAGAEFVVTLSRRETAE